MNPIYKTFFGKTIDLSKIISIDEPKFFLYDDYHGMCVKFEIICQLLDNPIIATVDPTEEEVYINLKQKDDTGFYPRMIKLVDGEEKRYQDLNKEDIPIFLARVQYQVDDLIQIWTNYRLEQERG